MGYIDERWGKYKRISRENVKSSILHAPYERNFVDKQKSRENALGSHFDVLLEGKLDHKQKRRENAMIRRCGPGVCAVESRGPVPDFDQKARLRAKKGIGSR